VDAVVLDLFGTLVTAPTPRERTHATSRLATVIGCDTAVVERYFRDTWHARHDGTLPTVTDLAEHLIRTVNGPTEMVGQVTDELHALGQARLLPDPSIVHTLTTLRSRGVRLGILSDASAEIAPPCREAL